MQGLSSSPSSVPQEKDITPDPQLLDKVNDGSSQMDFMRFHNQPVTQLPSDLADIVDFFIALTICNTVVVSSPNQPRQKVPSILTPPGCGSSRVTPLTAPLLLLVQKNIKQSKAERKKINKKTLPPPCCYVFGLFLSLSLSYCSHS